MDSQKIKWLPILTRFFKIFIPSVLVEPKPCLVVDSQGQFVKPVRLTFFGISIVFIQILSYLFISRCNSAEKMGFLAFKIY